MFSLVILRTQMQKLVVALRRGVIVHDVEVSLAIIAIHHVVPAQCIGTAHEATVEDRQLPVFAVIDLSGTRHNERQPHRPPGVRLPCSPVALVLLQLRAVRQSLLVHTHKTVLSHKLLGMDGVAGLVVAGGLCLEALRTAEETKDGNCYNNIMCNIHILNGGRHYGTATALSPLCGFLLQSVEDTHDMFELLLILKGDADLAFALARARQLDFCAEEIGQMITQRSVSLRQ
jgi:hypothetical protein